MLNSTYLRAALLALGGSILFTVMAAIVRHLGDSVHFTIQVFFRNLFVFVFMLPWALTHWRTAFQPRRPWLHVGRAGAGWVSQLCWYWALVLIPVAEVTALGFTAPLFATVLAVPLLGERLRFRRTAALLIGFVGTVITLRPGFGEFGLGQTIALINAAIVSGGLIAMKALTRDDSPETIVTLNALLLVPFSGALAAYFWTTPTLEQFLWLAVLGISATVGHVMNTHAYKMADATALMPIDFLRLIFAVAIGAWAFDDQPDIWTFVGGGLIFGASVYIARREARLSRAREQKDGAG
ncbi:MAG: DMT family transporter [Alphaproteobacteria bacterium]|nr:DMT family transporter [Alphaproteobacteria bacterium]